MEEQFIEDATAEQGLGLTRVELEQEYDRRGKQIMESLFEAHVEPRCVSDASLHMRIWFQIFRARDAGFSWGQEQLEYSLMAARTENSRSRHYYAYYHTRSDAEEAGHVHVAENQEANDMDLAELVADIAAADVPELDEIMAMPEDAEPEPMEPAGEGLADVENDEWNVPAPPPPAIPAEILELNEAQLQEIWESLQRLERKDAEPEAHELEDMVAAPEDAEPEPIEPAGEAENVVAPPAPAVPAEPDEAQVQEDRARHLRALEQEVQDMIAALEDALDGPIEPIENAENVVAPPAPAVPAEVPEHDGAQGMAFQQELDDIAVAPEDEPAGPGLDDAENAGNVWAPPVPAVHNPDWRPTPPDWAIERNNMAVILCEAWHSETEVEVDELMGRLNMYFIFKTGIHGHQDFARHFVEAYRGSVIDVEQYIATANDNEEREAFHDAYADLDDELLDMFEESLARYANLFLGRDHIPFQFE
ncbi:hypothetical protein QBC40DRAFT_301122 [Triangularia verruculosa]|uniref:Uncharacterized protein n=1 Tax=Triangularia verruculosa TaxID=2587418 RepID=A0AAN7AR68_9PEZI|nr:hypothetical protein QBC40DRAFT_301122 [Triangularia verruculosa]